MQQIYRSPVNLQHIFRKPFTKNTPGWLLLHDPLLSLRLFNQISMCWKWVSGKKTPGKKASREGSGVGLGLG